jgi:hypothetical protein
MARVAARNSIPDSERLRLTEGGLDLDQVRIAAVVAGALD